MTKPSSSDIKAIMQSYGLDDSAFKGTALIHNYKSAVAIIEKTFNLDTIEVALSPHIDNVEVEILKLIQFLRACEGSTLELRGIITKPKVKGQIKGQELRAEISNKEFLTWLDLFVCSYSNWFIAKDKGFGDIVEWGDDGPVFAEIQDPFSTGPCEWEDLSDEEIAVRIFNYTRSLKKELKLTRNSRYGRLAEGLIADFQPVCTGWTKTKFYSFVYDIMRLGKFTGKACITSKGFSGNIGREKLQQVKNWLRAWERDRKKFEERIREG